MSRASRRRRAYRWTRYLIRTQKRGVHASIPYSLYGALMDPPRRLDADDRRLLGQLRRAQRENR